MGLSSADKEEEISSDADVCTFLLKNFEFFEIYKGIRPDKGGGGGRGG